MSNWNTPLPDPTNATDMFSRINSAIQEVRGKTAYTDTGIYVPPNWGTRWRAARDSGTARLVCVGDSITQGFYASNIVTKSWPGLVRTALQSQYGDGGDGFMGIVNSGVFMTGDPTAVSFWTAAGCLATSTGTWTLDANSLIGPGIMTVDTDISGTSMTFPVRGSVIKIFTATGGTRANYTYSVDGGSPVTVTDAGGGGALAVQVTVVSGLTSGSHTVKVSWAGTASGTGQKLTLCGVAAENPTGIKVDNLARSGSRSAGFSVYDPARASATWNGGVNYPADLAIWSLGINDAKANVTGDAWASSFAKYVKAVRDDTGLDGSTDLMIVMQHIGSEDNSTFKYQDYVSRVHGLAEAYNVALVDMWAVGRNSWAYWDGLGYFADKLNPGASGHDNAHLCDIGHAAVANAVLPIVLS